MYQFDSDTPIGRNMSYFIKWSILSVMIGIVTGLVGSAFGHAVILAGNFFKANGWTLCLLPAAGLLIVWIYHVFKQDKSRGTNTVIESIYTESDISPGMIPSVFLGTILTHICGGSSGREGAAIQMGGSIGDQIGKLMRLDDKDRKIAVMCGMSGAFAALFGTPMAAAIFSMEVISIGVMYYAALVPCIFSSFIGAAIAKKLFLKPEAFIIGPVPEFGLKMALIMMILGALCAVISMIFCILLHGTAHAYEKYFKTPGKRVVVGGLFVILLTFLVGNTNYNGSGMGLIETCFEGEVRYEAFLWKILFTAVTLEAGFKGGEIVPTLCIGATFGCSFAMLTGQPHGLMAACGMLALFAGVTNCPISSLLIGFELFGYEAMPFFMIVIAVSFTLSGYYSLYSSQKFVYSKTKTEYINRKTNTYKKNGFE